MRVIGGRISLVRFDSSKLNLPKNCVVLSLTFSISFCLYLDRLCSGFGLSSESAILDDDNAK